MSNLKSTFYTHMNSNLLSPKHIFLGNVKSLGVDTTSKYSLNNIELFHGAGVFGNDELKSIKRYLPTRLSERYSFVNKTINELSETEGKHRHSRPIYRHGWLAIPNVSHFSVITSEYNPTWQTLGFKIKDPPNILFKKHVNGQANKYMVSQLSRLERLRSDPDKYWKVVRSLCINSTAFRMSAIHRVLWGWYRNMSIRQVLKINSQVTELIRTNSWEVKATRVYLPKGNTWRPLGVPRQCWRVYLHMQNNFLQQFVQEAYLPSQHGFIKGRGTLTAWKEVMDKVIDAPFIFECDLKQFFPYVRLSSIYDKLIELGMPKDMAKWFHNINTNPLTYPERHLLDEGFWLRKNVTFGDRKKYLEKHGIKSGDSDKDLSEVNYFTKAYRWIVNGVGQGNPTSPSLSILILREFLTQVCSLSYADDPIFYFHKLFVVLDDITRGIILNKTKSFWVRKDGIWLTKLKYLGLEYDPFTNSLHNKTRTRHEFPLALTMDRVIHLLKAFESEEKDKKGIRFEPWGIEESLHSTHNWRILFSKRKIIGVIQSRLYGNTWERPRNPWELSKATPNSWENLFRHYAVHRDLSTMSSYASEFLLEKLTQNRLSTTGLTKKIRFVYLKPHQLRSPIKVLHFWDDSIWLNKMHVQSRLSE